MTNPVIEKINLYIQSNPQLKTLSEEKIISIMVEKGVLSEAEAKKISAFAKNNTNTSDKGISLEHTESGTKADNTPINIDFTEPEAEDYSIEMITENAQNANNILQNIDNGAITQEYDNIKNLLDTEFSSNNVREAIEYEENSATFLIRAKNGDLTKKEYIKENKNRISDMLLKRLEREDEESGIDFIEKNRGKFSREEYTKLLQTEINRRINLIRNVEDLKTMQLEITGLTEDEELQLMNNIAESALNSTIKKPKDITNKISIELPPLENTVGKNELMDFKTTFKYERGTEFSKESMENLKKSKSELSFATGAYNKTQLLKNSVNKFMEDYDAAKKVYMTADNIAVGGNEPSATNRTDEISTFLTEYYNGANPETTQKNLNNIIQKQNLHIKINTNENGNIIIDFGEVYKTDFDKNRALNTFLKVLVQEQEKKLNNILNGQSYESYISQYQTDYKIGLGERNAEAFANAFKEDQLTVIDNVSGITSMAGMGIMIVGGIMTATGVGTPAGMGLVSLGGKIALTGMASRHILGFSDEYSKNNPEDERLKRMYKDLALDLGGMIIGGIAGRQGLQYASQVFKNTGNKALAMMVEKGTDFTLSAAGDLAMIGALDYDQGLEQTLKNNGIGIIVSTLTGIKASKELFKNDFDMPANTIPKAESTTSRITPDELRYSDETIAPAHQNSHQNSHQDNLAVEHGITNTEEGIVIINTKEAQAKAKENLANACQVNGKTSEELRTTAEFLINKLKVNINETAEIINNYKDDNGSINPNIIESIKIIHDNKLQITKDITEACTNPDGTIKEDALNTALELRKQKGVTINTIPILMKLAKDENGNFSKEIMDKLTAPLIRAERPPITLDGAGRILEQCTKGDKIDEVLYSKAQELQSQNYDATTIQCALSATKDGDGNFNAQNYTNVNKMLKAGITKSYIETISNAIKKDGIIDEHLMQKMISLKERGIKEFHLESYLNAAKDENGNYSEFLFDKLDELRNNPATSKRATWILTASKNKNGEFVEKNYNTIKKLYETLPDLLHTRIQTIYANSIDEAGNINDTYYKATIDLFNKKFDNNSISLIMNSCKIKDENGNNTFANDLHTRVINAVDEITNSSNKPLNSATLSIENNKVAIKCLFTDSTTKTHRFDLGVNNLKIKENETTQKTNGNKPVKITKSEDLEHNIQTKTRQAYDATNTLLNEVNIIRDKDGNIIRTEYLSHSDVPGILDVRIKTPNNETKVISSGKVDPVTGHTLVEKHMESLDGTMTHYRYEDDPQGNRIIDYKIVDKDGNILMNDSQTFEVISDTKMISSYNDNVYEININGNKLTVDSKTTGESVEFNLDTYLSEKSNKEMLIGLLKQMPGHELINLNKKVKTLSSTDYKIQSKHIPFTKEIITANDLSILLHEAGHSKHSTGSSEFEFNEEFIKIFNEEREAFKKAFPDIQQKHLEYFINDKLHLNNAIAPRKKGTLEETVAETNSLLNTYFHSPELQIRAHYLQQYFPRTIAELSKIMKNNPEDLVKVTGKTAANSQAAITHNIIDNSRLNKLSEEEFTNEILGLVSEFRKHENQQISEAEIANEINEFRNSEELRTIINSYKTHPDVYTIILKKDADNKYKFANGNKYAYILDSLDRTTRDSNQEIAEDLQLAEKIYDYIYTPEKHNAESLGLGERQLKILQEKINNLENKNDYIEINNIVKYIVNIKNDEKLDLSIQLKEKYNLTEYDIAELLPKLKTEEDIAIFTQIANKNTWDNYYYSNILNLKDVPYFKERLNKILENEDYKARAEELTALGSITYNKEKLIKRDLLKHENLNIETIKSLVYLKDEDFQEKVVQRNILDDTTLSNKSILHIARMDDDNYAYALKLIKNGLDANETFEYFSYSNLKYVFANRDYLFDFKLTLDDVRTLSYQSSENLAKLERFKDTPGFKTRPFNDVINIIRNLNEQNLNIAESRGLLDDTTIDIGMIQTLTALDDNSFRIAQERDIINNIKQEEDANWYIYDLIHLGDAEYAKYLQINNNPTENLKNRHLTIREKIEFARYPEEQIEEFDKFLYFPNRTEQFKIKDLEKISRSLTDNQVSFEEFARLANLDIFAKQNQPSLNHEEIMHLIKLDKNTQDEILKLVTHEQRNAIGQRINAISAKTLYEDLNNPDMFPYGNKEEAVQLLEKLIYIPERGNNQIKSEFLPQLLVQIGTLEKFDKYKDFIYSPERQNNNINQLHESTLFKMIISLPDENLANAKKLLFIPERGNYQLSDDTILLLAKTEPEQFAKIEKFIHSPEIIDNYLSALVDMNDQQLNKLNTLINSEYELNSKILIEASKLDDESFTNFTNLVSKYKTNHHLLYDIAKLKGVNYNQALELLGNETFKNYTEIFNQIAALDEAEFERAKFFCEKGVEKNSIIPLAKSKDLQILDKFNKALDEAKKKRNQLKSGVADLTDENIDNFFYSNMPKIIKTIDMLGVATFTHSFTTKLTGVENFINSVEQLSSRIMPDKFEELKTRLNDKSIEPQEKIAKIKTLAAINSRTYDISTYIDLIKSNTPTKEDIQTAKAIWANPKAKFDDKFNEFCKTFDIDPNNKKVIDFFDKRAQVNAKGYKILNGVKEAELSKLLEIEVVRKRNDKEWNKAIDEKVYELIGVRYSPELSQKLNLAENRYLQSVFQGNRGFKDNFGEMVDIIIENPDKSIRDTFNDLPHNLETRRQFEERGIDYDKWVDADKNSYKIVEVEASAQQSRQAAIANVEADFNDPDFKTIPKEETDKIFAALKEIGITTITKKEPRYDEDGFIRGYNEISRLYENGKPISFSKLEKAISVIKKVINENEFWTKTNSDPKIDAARTTIYNHIMKLRDAEIEAAAKIKDDEIATLEVHKTDMNNISHSLFLGNHAGCCTAIGSSIGNDYAAPRYIMDKCISAIEVMDGKEFVGNTMCYFAEVDGKLALVLDNIEMNTKYQNNDQIRDVFMEYAKQLCEEVGKPDLPIYAGPYRHKFNMTPYPIDSHDIKILGSSDGENTYIDFSGHYIIDGQKISRTNLYKIR